MYITAYLYGGLGNQLFQIFAVISYSIKNNCNFNFFLKDNRNFSRWGNLLVTLNEYIIDELPKYIYNEDTHSYKEIPVYDKPFMINGYFQSSKYFNNYKDNIIDLIGIREHQNRYSYLYNYDNIVSIHFRLGDYKRLEKYHPILPIDYYISSLNLLINKTKRNDWIVLYFYEENDEPIVSNNINILLNKFPHIKFTGINHNYSDWQQVLIMSLCKHNIIANSTFSWWGAYLNNNNEVFYPSLWFGESLKDKLTHDIPMDNWIKVNC